MTQPKRKPCEVCGGDPYGALLMCDEWMDADAGRHKLHDLCEPCADALIAVQGDEKKEPWYPRCPNGMTEDDRVMVVLARQS